MKIYEALHSKSADPLVSVTLPSSSHTQHMKQKGVEKGDGMSKDKNVWLTVLSSS